MKSLEKNEPIPNGVAHRSNGGIVFAESHDLHEDFSGNAPPDYDDFFEQLRQIDPDSSLLENPVILYETARGCWWGEKHHCTFCGLNATTMKFRSKPMDQVHADISYLSQRYDSFRFRLVDNILEMKYIEGIFGEMARNNFDLQFFLEVKSNLTKQQIKSLARGGANVIQPGIESFSLNQLMEMDKGVRPLQNILCMKWAMYYGVEVNWNILIGFPGETDEDYHQQIQLIKLLFHLPPPECVGDLWLERFSPYYTRPEEYGVTITGPGEAYSYVYDSEDIDLFRIAYDYEFTTKNEIDPGLKKELFDTAEEWKRRHQSDELPYLIFTKSMNFVTVYDDRSIGNPNKNRFEGSPAWTIVFCNESPKTMDQIKKHVQELGAEEGAAEKGVLQLEKMGILYGEKGKYLTLALPHNANL
jgi:ribosomal peptide maturation radical SAM protein 1